MPPQPPEAHFTTWGTYRQMSELGLDSFSVPGLQANLANTIPAIVLFGAAATAAVAAGLTAGIVGASAAASTAVVTALTGLSTAFLAGRGLVVRFELRQHDQRHRLRGGTRANSRSRL